MRFQDFKIKENIWGFTFFCLLFPLMVNGQNQNAEVAPEEKITSDLHLTFSAQDDSILLKFVPTKLETWLLTNKDGFRISRTTLGENGIPLAGSETIIAGRNHLEQLKSKNQIWFQKNGALLDSIINEVGAILYDPAYNIGVDKSNNDQARFDALVGMASYSFEIGESIGWAFVDKNVAKEKTYEYTIQSLDASGKVFVSEKLTIENADQNINEYPYGYVYSPSSTVEGGGQVFAPGFQMNQVLMKALPKGDSIVLRWGPNSAKFWQESILKGYILTRVGVDSKGEDASFTKKIMPYDSLQFMQLKNPDSMVMAAAQVMYGKTLKFNEADFINQSSVLENRFAMGMIAAERSAQAADALGLRYVDKEVEPGMQYVYELMSVADSSVLSRYLLMVENKKEETSTPELFEANALDQIIELSWPKEYNQAKYSTYRIERSDDGGRTFKSLNVSPMFFLENEEENENSNFFFQDSVDQNYKTYHYRLFGKNAFAEWSNPAELKVQARDFTPPPNPFIVSVEEQGNGAVDIKWEIKTEPSDLKGYSVLLGETDDGAFTTLSNVLIPPGTKQYTYRTNSLRTDIAYYFKISAVDTAGNASNSFPHFLNVVDSIAPAPPTGLIGSIDSSGVVTIGWEVGTEKDLNGYRVYFANSDKYEFTQKTVGAITYNFFLDTIEIKTLTEEIYYKVQSVDLRHNRSEFSEILKLQKPDILPPTTPVFRQPKVSSDSIVLTWIPSISDDVVSHILYRKKHQSENDWEILATLGANDTLFVDLTGETEQLYEYTLRAQDDADLFSEYAFVHKARKWFDGKIIAIQNLQIQQDTSVENAITLNWDFQKPTTNILKNVEYRFYVYRSLGDSPLERYRQLESGEQDFKDTKVKKEEKYNYAVKVVFRNGKTSPLSEMVSLGK